MFTSSQPDSLERAKPLPSGEPVARDLLLQQFDSLADTPGAVPKLRALILDLAVRGCLVPQNQNEGTGAELLASTLEEKRRLTREGKVKKTSALEPIKTQDHLFPIPESWNWVHLNDFGDWGSGSTPNRGSREFYDGTIPWLKSGELNDGTVTESEEKVTDLALQKCSLRLNKPGDVLFAMYGATVGKVAILGVEATTNQAVCACTCFSGVFNRYLFLLLKAYKKQFISESAGAAQPNFSKDKIIRTIAPLPPLPEQCRIVAKVEELLALCDELEIRQTATRERLTRLVHSAIDHLTAAKDEQDFRKQCSFTLHNSSLILDSVPALRQAILSLAVQGKLALQDANDEPASGLLKRIHEWRASETKEKRIRTPKRILPPIAASEYPYELPAAWEWARLGVILYVHSGDGLTAEAMVPGGIPVFGGNGINGFHNNANVHRETIVIGRVGYYCGSIHVTPPEAWVTDNAFITEFCAEAIHQSFLALLLKATDLKEKEGATAQPVISGGKIYPIVVGLPPLAEQKRIVAKVDELMRWCDQLETHLATARTAGTHLLDATLDRALKGES